jgi:hypothetical protein
MPVKVQMLPLVVKRTGTIWHVTGTNPADCTFPLVSVAPAIGLESMR